MFGALTAPVTNQRLLDLGRASSIIILIRWTANHLRNTIKGASCNERHVPGRGVTTNISDVSKGGGGGGGVFLSFFRL